MNADQQPSTRMVALPRPATAKAAADRFTGAVWVDGITAGAEPGCARLATVRFSPGARTAWHCHTRGQTLHVTSGHGLVQTKDGQTIMMRPGDTVFTPPGVWHWHGAAPGFFMTHLALADSSADPGTADVNWGELVSDDEYDRAASTPRQRTRTRYPAR
jgi:quercetin dioxygenase-like cupin family protein